MQIRSLCSLLGACALVLGSTQASAANLVTNGSFEDVTVPSPYYSANPAYVPGWTHGGVVGDALIWAVGYADGGGSVSTAGDGRQFVTMGGGYDQPAQEGTWTTTVNVTPGQAYTLSFMLAAEGEIPTQNVQVTLAGASAQGPTSFTATTDGVWYWHQWTTQSLGFMANAAQVNITFSSLTSYDVGLDGVNVQAVPEPGSVALLGTGLALLGFTVRRRG